VPPVEITQRVCIIYPEVSNETFSILLPLGQRDSDG